MPVSARDKRKQRCELALVDTSAVIFSASAMKSRTMWVAARSIFGRARFTTAVGGVSARSFGRSIDALTLSRACLQRAHVVPSDFGLRVVLLAKTGCCRRKCRCKTNLLQRSQIVMFEAQSDRRPSCYQLRQRVRSRTFVLTGLSLGR